MLFSLSLVLLVLTNSVGLVVLPPAHVLLLQIVGSLGIIGGAIDLYMGSR